MKNGPGSVHDHSGNYLELKEGGKGGRPGQAILRARLRRLRPRQQDGDDLIKQVYEGVDAESRQVVFGKVFVDNEEDEDGGTITIEMSGFEYRFYLVGIDRDAHISRLNYI